MKEICWGVLNKPQIKVFYENLPKSRVRLKLVSSVLLVMQSKKNGKIRFLRLFKKVNVTLGTL